MQNIQLNTQDFRGPFHLIPKSSFLLKIVFENLPCAIFTPGGGYRSAEDNPGPCSPETSILVKVETINKQTDQVRNQMVMNTVKGIQTGWCDWVTT